MAPAVGIEPTSSVLETEALPIDDTDIIMEEAMGLEPMIGTL